MGSSDGFRFGSIVRQSSRSALLAALTMAKVVMVWELHVNKLPMGLAMGLVFGRGSLVAWMAYAPAFLAVLSAATNNKALEVTPPCWESQEVTRWRVGWKCGGYS
jgi:hypothetical protein